MIKREYHVEFVLPSEIRPSPENDDIYGEVTEDSAMEMLIESIGRRGLEEPIIVSSDGFIISGHRRYFAATKLELSEIPVRRKEISRSKNLSQWPRILTEYNPQRIKTAGTLLKEALLRHSNDSSQLLYDHKRASTQVDAEFTDVGGVKYVRNISDKKREFLDAAKKIINETLRKFWPVTVRQVHYQLLNKPPLITKPKRSKFDLEHYRYRNDNRSYEALIELLKQARYAGEIPMHCIDDPTRPKYEYRAYSDLSEFIQREMDGFLTGYHRSPQLDQPRHIEILGEKNTLLSIVQPVCQDYYIPLTLARGYASTPVWREMARRFKHSGKSAFTLIVLSDWDPEGLDLAEDAIRSLRDLWSIDVDYHRVGVVKQQIEDLELSEDFNPAKVTSSRFAKFVEETGGEETWELEALPPEYLRDQVRAAIEANMDMDIYEESIERVEADVQELSEIRDQIVESIDL